MDITDVKSIDEYIKQNISGEQLTKYIELTQDLVQKISILSETSKFYEEDE